MPKLTRSATLVDVARLIRVAYGDYKLDTIPPGMAIEVNCKPIQSQRNRGQLFPKRHKTIPKSEQAQAKDQSSSVQWVRYL
jgi:hypothetical protein